MPGKDVGVIARRTAGMLLVAAPPLVDPNFDRSVVMMLEHSDEGAIGVVLNRPTGHEVPDVLDAWKSRCVAPAELFAGGPVQIDGIIGIGVDEGSRVVTLDLGDPLSHTDGPVRLFAGYAGWGPGQLDGELAARAWIVTTMEPNDPFAPDTGDLWRQVLARQSGSLAWMANFPDDVSSN